jgi:hypothetical protein
LRPLNALRVSGCPSDAGSVKSGAWVATGRRSGTVIDPPAPLILSQS